MFQYVRAALAAAALFLIAPIMKANPAPDKDGHVLTALWKQYEEANKADLRFEGSLSRDTDGLAISAYTLPSSTANTIPLPGPLPQ